MRPLDVIRETLSALAAHKLRTALSALGVVIGVAAVVAIVAMVQGASQQVQAQISGLGVRSINVNLRTDLNATGSSATQLAQDLRAEPAVSEVVPIVNGSAKIDAAEEKGSPSSASQPATGASMRGPTPISVAGQGRRLQLVGTTDDYATMHDYTPVQGRFLHPLDEDRPVIVLGSGAAQQLRRNGLDPEPGEGLTLSAFGRRLHFQIVGVMGPRGRVGFNNLDQQAYVPASMLQRLSGSGGAESFLAQATSEDTVTEAANRIRSVLDEHLDASDGAGMRSAANPGPKQGPSREGRHTRCARNSRRCRRSSRHARP
ncbi:MAG: ABC transporter permease [Candidatus Bipolaricaulia bacterium]